MRIMGWAGIVVLMACAPQRPDVPLPVAQPKLTADLLKAAPAAGQKGCWQKLDRPAVFETVTHQVQIAEAKRDKDGKVITPAKLQSEVTQKQIRPREVVWFRSLCKEDGLNDPIFIASLQRALKARGLFKGEVSGVMDAQTNAAVQRYQAAGGLDTPVLSRAAAIALGLIPVEI